MPEYGLMCDLLWSDPKEDGGKGWDKNKIRGVSYVFGADVVKEFCEKHDIDMICRGHMV